MSKKVSGRQAAVDFLIESGGGPLPVKDVTAEAASRAKLKGKTPQATIAAQIYTAAKKGVLFKMTGRGMVKLLPAVEAKTEASEPKQLAGPVASDEATIEADLARGTAAASGKREVKPDPKPASKSRKKEAVAA